ncbi:hypothetical protein JCM10207_003122 [Rhodosporidiobolus poonsookiae]
MLSRLKRRTASSTYPDATDSPSHSPPDTDDPTSALDSHTYHQQNGNAPTANHRTHALTTPTKSKDSQLSPTRTLSPTRSINSNGTRASRSSSFASLNPPDRRMLNLSLPNDLSGGPVLVANGPGLGAGNLAVGEGSLSLDHLAPPVGHANMTLVVQAPELIVDGTASDVETGGSTPIAESADMRTPVASFHPDFAGPNQHHDLRARGMSSASNPVVVASLAPAVGRPRSHTTSEALLGARSYAQQQQQEQNGLDALAEINVSTSLANSRSASRDRSATTSPPSGSRPASRSASRPGSRSSSVSQQQQQQYLDTGATLRPPLASVSPSRSRKPARSVSTGASSPSSGIAGALALSGVALASPNGALRHPHGLRLAPSVSADGADGTRARAAAAAASGAERTSAPASARESLDGTSSPTGSLGAGSMSGAGGASAAGAGLVAEDFASDDGASMYGPGDATGFLSMDQLGDFDDVVSQLGTGYAVASSKRNADFHALFKNIPEDDYLIEDYGCALQREILIQGRLYISEHHLSFYANIFGWVTSLTIPFSEVCSIEKRMTAYVIPNAIQVATMHARHTFASFLSRDTTYDLIGNIWRMIHPVVPMSAALPDALSDPRPSVGHSHADSDDEDGAGAEGGEDGEARSTAVEADAGAPQKAKRRLRGFRRPRGGTGESKRGGEAVGKGGEDDKDAASGGAALADADGEAAKAKKGKAAVHPPTVDTCPTLKGLKEVCMDVVFPGKPEKIYNLMFTSGFMKDFWGDNQKLMEIQIGDWAPQASGSNLLARSMSYIKPLSGSIGPKQTKCLITDESAHVDFDDFVCVVTTTRTPDVPSGGAFAVKTRTSMTWARGNHCRVVVTTGVEWSKSSFIKGIIEKSCIDGQKTYHSDLEKAMRSYISTHRNEFVEEGHDPDEASLASGGDDAPPSPLDAQPGGGLGGAEAAATPAPRTGALAPLLDLLGPLADLVSDQSPKTLLLAAVVVILVVSNLWTLRSSSSSAVPRSAYSHPAERAARARGEYVPPYAGVGYDAHAGAGAAGGQGGAHHASEVASAVRDVLEGYFAVPGAAPRAVPAAESAAPNVGPRDELRELERLLDQVEERVRRLRGEVAAAHELEGALSAEEVD